MNTVTVGGFAHMLNEQRQPVREPIALHYDKRDPFAVELTFTGADHRQPNGEALTWVFARELLREGLDVHAGIGDVRLWPVGTQCLQVHITLTSPEGTGIGWLPATLVRLFLARADKLVPRGSETFDVDGVIDGCLSGRRRGL